MEEELTRWLEITRLFSTYVLLPVRCDVRNVLGLSGDVCVEGGGVSWVICSLRDMTQREMEEEVAGL